MIRANQRDLRTHDNSHSLRLVKSSQSEPCLRLLNGGQETFSYVLKKVDRARKSIEIRAFVWRDDETGNMLASALLRAANRGVQIVIYKDRIGANYEYYSGTRQSFFHKKIALDQRIATLFLHGVYHEDAGSFKQRPNVLSEALLEHPLVTVHHDKKRFDHSKVYIFDEESFVLGGVGIGDDHREWVDVMVAGDGRLMVERLRNRLEDRVAFDSSRSVDFLLHRRDTPTHLGCPMLAQRLALIDSAEKSVTVAMAYLGDERFTQALVRAANRGVKIFLLVPAMSDFLGAINRSICDRMLRSARQNMTISMLPSPMVHAKVVVVDRKIADVGSANFTSLSHGIYDEVDIHINDEGFAGVVEDAVMGHAQKGEQMVGRIRRSRITEIVERMIVGFQGRHSA